ncbi:MAG: sigma 54-interacting transcriptional regulator [Firmicutes bacterium]|nr:sigma 54-interacting transcriptional regulator [Bacillota bacterium]
MPRMDSVISKRPPTLESGQPLSRLLLLWQRPETNLVGVINGSGRLIGVLGKGLTPGMFEEVSPDTPVDSLMSTGFTQVGPELMLEETFNLPGEILAVVDEKFGVLGLFTKLELSDLVYRHLRSRVQELDAIINGAISGVIAINREGIVTVLNPAGERIIRRKREDCIGKPLSEVVIPSGLLDILRTGEVHVNKRLTLAFSKGVRFYLTNRSPVIEKGQVVGAVGVFQDVTDAEFMSQELTFIKQVNKELQALIDSSYDAVLITNNKGIVHRINQAYTRMTGHKESEVMSRPFSELHPENGSDISIVEEALEQKKSVSRIQVSPLGNRLLFTANPVLDEDGSIFRLVINARDLSEIEILRNDLDESISLTRRYREELANLQLTKEFNLHSNSPEMQQTIDLCTRVARVGSTVLLLGESGVGKEVLAKLIHSLSGHSDGPYVKINCGAIPESLLESELFGYERGAFSGASKEGKAGLFEMANNGTILLDEIGELPLSLQVKLLRVLQDKEFTRLGGTIPKRVNVRILAASNRDLEQMVEEGTFREDLFFRLNVVTVNIPPLRRRKADLIPLLSHFKESFCRKYGMEKKFDPEVIKIFMRYEWPGNIRELENIVEGLIVTTDGPNITPSSLPPAFLKKVGASEDGVFDQGLLPLKEAVQILEDKLITRAMEKYGSTHKAAAILGVNQSTLVRKLARKKNESAPEVSKRPR